LQKFHNNPEKKKADAARPRSLQMQKVDDDLNDFDDGDSDDEDDEDLSEDVKPVKTKPSNNRRGSYSG
jgi:hypothetical protein